MHLRFLNNCSQLASHHEPLSTRRRTVTCGWRFVGRPKVAQLYVRIGFFIKFILFYYQEYGNWKITSSIDSYRNKHPQPNTGCVDSEGVRWSAPYPPHPPKKSHVLWVSIEISIPRHPKINKNTVTPHLVRRNAAGTTIFWNFKCSQGKHLWDFQFAPTKLNPWRGSGQLLISNRCADPEGDRWSGHPPPKKKK